MLQNKFRMIVWMTLCSLFITCNRPGNNDFPSDDRVEIRLSADTLYAASLVSNAIDICITNRSAVQKLVIKKQDSKGITTHESIPAAGLAESYTFTYQPNTGDEDRFYFILQAQNENNKVLASKNLVVETRYGIIVSGLVKISRVTGKTLNDEHIANPNRTDERYNVGGTDLGIIWDMENGSYGLFFGDTYGKSFIPVPGGGPGAAGDWRSNVLAFSSDTDLDDGLRFSGMAVDNSGNAREIAWSAKNTSGNGDYTSIPTAAIHADGVDYLHYMNIRTWTGWVTNYSALYASDNHGETWRHCSEVIFQSNSPFGQVALAKKDGYVYMMGTPTGRDGSACLARIPEKSMLKQADYEYRNAGQGWVKGSETQATVMIDGKVGEASLMYHRKFGRWIYTYFDPEEYALCYRDAADITGPWTKEKILVKSADYPALYGSFMHPAKDADDRLYFTMSQWGPYNVFLMRADLQCIK
ncbi:MAG: DUF4185 domain-containing protein [Dysgonamonadaceae bacterium]|jgi:hypothetical protein|nr:DUF4185 domain-containing protein [Dysgonamonadaceae bacterium]